MTAKDVILARRLGGGSGGGGGDAITDGFVVTARDAGGLVAAADVYFSHIPTGVFGFTYTGSSAGAFTIMAQKAQTINFVVPVISVENGAFRGNRSPASQIEKVFPTITKDGDGSFTNSLIETHICRCWRIHMGTSLRDAVNCGRLTYRLPKAK